VGLIRENVNVQQLPMGYSRPSSELPNTITTQAATTTPRASTNPPASTNQQGSSMGTGDNNVRHAAHIQGRATVSASNLTTAQGSYTVNGCPSNYSQQTLTVTSELVMSQQELSLVNFSRRLEEITAVQNDVDIEDNISFNLGNFVADFVEFLKLRWNSCYNLVKILSKPTRKKENSLITSKGAWKH